MLNLLPMQIHSLFELTFLTFMVFSNLSYKSILMGFKPLHFLQSTSRIFSKTCSSWNSSAIQHWILISFPSPFLFKPLLLFTFIFNVFQIFGSKLPQNLKFSNSFFNINFPSFLSLFLFVSSWIHLSAFQHANFITSLFVSLITWCLNDKSQLTSTKITMFTFICWHFWSHFFKYFNSHFSHQNFTKVSSCYLFKKVTKHFKCVNFSYQNKIVSLITKLLNIFPFSQIHFHWKLSLVHLLPKQHFIINQLDCIEVSEFSQVLLLKNF